METKHTTKTFRQKKKKLAQPPKGTFGRKWYHMWGSGKKSPFAFPGVIFLVYIVLLQNAISIITGVILLPKIKLWCSQSLILCLNAHSNLILWGFLFSINLHTPGHLKAFSTPRSQPLPSLSTAIQTFLQSLILHIFSFSLCCSNGCKHCIPAL